MGYLEITFPVPYQCAFFFCEWGGAVVLYPRQRKGAGFTVLKETWTLKARGARCLPEMITVQVDGKANPLG